MGIFDFLKPIDIDAGVEEFQNTDGGILVDVRAVEEYKEGHIKGSINLPLHLLPIKAEEVLDDLDVPIFVYCHSGGRSSQAVSLLKNMGYNQVKNIGGICNYKGEIER